VASCNALSSIEQPYRIGTVPVATKTTGVHCHMIC
jgi:hypothetical protein